MLSLDTLMELKNSITKYIKQNISMFKSFNNIYLFGSILDDNAMPNDVDILLIYSKYSEKIGHDSAIICSILENKFGLPVDLTILSMNEAKETRFLNRLNSLYLKLK